MVDKELIRQLALRTFDGEADAALIYLDAIMEEEPEEIDRMLLSPLEAMRSLKDSLQMQKRIRIENEQTVAVIQKTAKFSCVYRIVMSRVWVTVSEAGNLAEITRFSWPFEDPDDIKPDSWGTYVDLYYGAYGGVLFRYPDELPPGNPIRQRFEQTETEIPYEVPCPDIRKPCLISPADVRKIRDMGEEVRQMDIPGKFMKAGEMLHKAALKIRGRTKKSR